LAPASGAGSARRVGRAVAVLREAVAIAVLPCLPPGMPREFAGGNPVGSYCNRIGQQPRL